MPGGPDNTIADNTIADNTIADNTTDNSAANAAVAAAVAAYLAAEKAKQHDKEPEVIFISPLSAAQPGPDNPERTPEQYTAAGTCCAACCCGPCCTGVFYGISSALATLVAPNLFLPSFITDFPNFATSVGIGALTFTLAIIPMLIAKRKFENSTFFKKHNLFGEFLFNNVLFMIGTAATAAAIEIVGSPLLPTLFPLLFLPAVYLAIKHVKTLLKLCCGDSQAHDAEDDSAHSII